MSLAYHALTSYFELVSTATDPKGAGSLFAATAKIILWYETHIAYYRADNTPSFGWDVKPKSSVCTHAEHHAHTCNTSVIGGLEIHENTQHAPILGSHTHSGMHTDKLILDLPTAFDNEPHERLFRKINQYDIRENTLAWIRGFLMVRSQTVLLDGFRSAPASVISGLPQGTVLGPLLLTARVRLFSDNCIVYRPV